MNADDEGVTVGSANGDYTRRGRRFEKITEMCVLTLKERVYIEDAGEERMETRERKRARARRRARERERDVRDATPRMCPIL